MVLCVEPLIFLRSRQKFHVPLGFHENLNIICLRLYFFIQMSLTKTLRDIVRSCYEHFRQPHLLAEQANKSTDDLESIKVVNNDDGSVMFISSDDVTVLEDGSSTKVRCHFKLQFKIASTMTYAGFVRGMEILE